MFVCWTILCTHAFYFLVHQQCANEREKEITCQFCTFSRVDMFRIGKDMIGIESLHLNNSCCWCNILIGGRACLICLLGWSWFVCMLLSPASYLRSYKSLCIAVAQQLPLIAFEIEKENNTHTLRFILSLRTSSVSSSLTLSVRSRPLLGLAASMKVTSWIESRHVIQ